MASVLGESFRLSLLPKGVFKTTESIILGGGDDSGLSPPYEVYSLVIQRPVPN